MLTNIILAILLWAQPFDLCEGELADKSHNVTHAIGKSLVMKSYPF